MASDFFRYGHGKVDCGATLIYIAHKIIDIAPDNLSKEDYLSAQIDIDQAAFWDRDIEECELFGEMLKRSNLIRSINFYGEVKNECMHGMSIVLRHLAQRNIPFRLEISLVGQHLQIPLRYISKILTDSAIFELECRRYSPFHERQNATIFDHQLHYLNESTLKQSKLQHLTLDVIFAKRILPYFMEIDTLVYLTLVSDDLPTYEGTSYLKECLAIINDSQLLSLTIDMRFCMPIELIKTVASLSLYGLSLTNMQDPDSHFQSLLDVIAGHPTLRRLHVINVEFIDDMTMKVVDCITKNKNLHSVFYSDSDSSRNTVFQTHPDYAYFEEIFKNRHCSVYMGDTIVDDFIYHRSFHRLFDHDEQVAFSEFSIRAGNINMEKQTEKSMTKIFKDIKNNPDVDPEHMDFIGCDLNQDLIDDLSNFRNLKTLTFHGNTFHPT